MASQLFNFAVSVRTHNQISPSHLLFRLAGDVLAGLTIASMLIPQSGYVASSGFSLVEGMVDARRGHSFLMKTDNRCTEGLLPSSPTASVGMNREWHPRDTFNFKL